MVAVVTAGLIAGCRDTPPPPEPAPSETGVTPITFTARTVLAFEYVDQSGAVRSVGNVAAVPRASRRVVRVIDPTAKPPLPGQDDVVQLADLAHPDSAGRFTTVLARRRMFRRRALIALPPGAASRVNLPAVRLPIDAPDTAAHDEIVIYGTSWCGACKQARAYLRKRKLAFVDRDVERDAAAAAKLAIELAALGVTPDRVPVIDVRGHLLVGFDPVRLRTLIGEQI